MKVLHIIICSRGIEANPLKEFARRLIRSQKMSLRACEALFTRGCKEYDPDPTVQVLRLETKILKAAPPDAPHPAVDAGDKSHSPSATHDPHTASPQPATH